MRLLNWNTGWLSPKSRNNKFEKARQLIASFDADVICLTEARVEMLPPPSEHAIKSELSGVGGPEERGARKVLLWSRYGWSEIDRLGAPQLPPGRFVKGITEVAGAQWTIIGMCIPYRNYRVEKKRGAQRKKVWAGAGEYLDGLRDILPPAKKQHRTVLLGDYNLQIPPFNYPYKNSAVNQKRQRTFAGWLIPTAGLKRRFIDHVAMSPDLRVQSLQFISRYAADGIELSDHDGVFIDIAPA